MLAVINQFILKLDSRYEKTRKPGAGSTVKRERVAGTPSTTPPPISLSSWMIDPSYKISSTSDIATVCIRESSMDSTQDSTVISGVCLYNWHLEDIV